jgi:dihydroxyacetone kinase
VARRVIARADELTALDQAIGDGDHGLNMKRGFEAVLAEARRDRRQAAARGAQGRSARRW